MATFNDPLLASQWHLRLLGDIARIWDEYSGAGVNVGVYDDGLQLLHPDLNDNYDGTLHFRYGSTTYNPTPIYLAPGPDSDGHGTSVAGIIAAEAGNGIGGVGVAWGASLTGVNLLEGAIGNSFSLQIASYEHAADFDIMSNSWGYDPFFSINLNRDDPFKTGARTEAAFGVAVTDGRGGLGTVIVKAAGNEAANSNGEGINGSRYVVSVAALTQTGAVQSYSNYGTNILVSAGAASVTTDLTGANGYGTAFGTAGDYTSYFGGTSAATPVVSGVVALMMEANETLGWRDVREILATSAALTGSGLGGAAGFEVEGFTSQGSGTWNGGGHAISRDYGYGRVDAFAAVRMAEVWNLWGGAANTAASEIQRTMTTPSDLNVFAVGGAMKPTLTFNESMWIEHIDVTVTFSFKRFFPDDDSGFEFTLVAPDGSRFSLIRAVDFLTDNSGALDLNSGFTWQFGVAHAIGLDMAGTWTLDVEGSGLGFNNAGRVTDFTLDFFGRAAGTNDVHHITKDFLTITGAGAANWNGGRDRVLTDDNGGTDWINLSALAGDVNLAIVSGGTIRVGGVQWAAFDNGNQFENVVSGDGADRLSGNGAANALHGMRGNDVLLGLDGADTLDGGAGNDRLVGGLVSDQLIGGAGHNVLYGGGGSDQVNGADGSGMLRGDGGNDVLTGGAGADRLDGGTDNDTLTGGGGNDLLTGGTGADRFIFAAGFGHDRITDFADNIDTLAFASAVAGGLGVTVFIDTFAQVSRGEVVFTFTDGSLLRVSGIGSLAQLYDDLVLV